MLKIHTARDGNLYSKHMVIIVTSTKENINATIEIIATPIAGSEEVLLDLRLLYPDVDDTLLTDIVHVQDIESMQTRENRRASNEKRPATKFPPSMARRSVPVIPVERPEHANVSSQGRSRSD